MDDRQVDRGRIEPNRSGLQSWYVSTLANRGVLGSLHPLQAILGLASECYTRDMRLRADHKKLRQIDRPRRRDPTMMKFDRLNEATPTSKAGI